VTIQSKLENIIQTLQLVLADAKKVDKGMRKPAIRVRKALGEAREACGRLRIEIIQVGHERRKGGEKDE